MPPSGGGGGQTYQNQTSESGPPKFLQPYLQEGINDLSGYYEHNKTAPSYYSGETVAPLSGVTNQAITAAQNNANSNPLIPGSVNSINNFTSGRYVNPNTNLDYQAALAYSHQPYLDQFNKQVLPGIQGTFSSAGRYGSGAQQAAVGQAVDSLNRNIAGADATAGSQYYQNALQQELQANSLIPGINSATLGNISALGAAGNTIDQNRQAQDAAAQAAYNYNSNKQMNYISQYLSALNGGYPGGSTTSSVFAQQYQPQNAFGGILGGATSLIGLGLQAAPLFSDARLKEDITPVGKLHDGQNIYSYRYKGDPHTHIGLLAQEVEETHPEAVIEHPSGYKMVDYKAATRGLF